MHVYVLTSLCTYVHIAEEVGLQLPKQFFQSPVLEYMPSEMQFHLEKQLPSALLLRHYVELVLLCVKQRPVCLVLRDAVGSSQDLWLAAALPFP